MQESKLKREGKDGTSGFFFYIRREAFRNMFAGFSTAPEFWVLWDLKREFDPQTRTVKYSVIVTPDLEKMRVLKEQAAEGQGGHTDGGKEKAVDDKEN